MDGFDWDRPPDVREAPPLPEAERAALRKFLNIEAWASRDVPAPDRLLGDLVTTTTRAFLVGRTGLGKTMLAVAMATGMAAGTGFLHWRSDRPARVLYIDGEMPTELIKARVIDALRRCPARFNPDNLIIFGADMADECAKLFPTLPPFAPLNTPAGQDFILALVKALTPDVVIFDNVMSLVAGDQKDEVPWNETLPLVQRLTAMRIGQVWLDHTGHDTSRQYGSSTKAWRFDSVGIMSPVDGDQHGETAFSLSFEPPGKCRRRTPDNRADFATTTIRLVDDRWLAEPVEEAGRAQGNAGHKLGTVPPSRKLFFEAFRDALAAGKGCGPGKVSKQAWEAECVRRNLMPAREGWDGKESSRTRDFRRAISELQAAHYLGSDGDTFADLT